MPTLKKVDSFYRKKKKIPNVIMGVTDSHEIIYGARALNKQLPSHLDKPTQDFDIFSPYPKKDAMQTEKALDKEFDGDYFYVEPAKHEGTWKVKAHINKEGYADYTKPEGKVPHRVIGGKKYVKLDYVKQHIRKTLKDKEAKYRWDKDRDSLNRIMVYEKMKKARSKKKTKVSVEKALRKIAGFK